LRNQLDAVPETDVSDPLKALEAIVGKALEDLRSTPQHVVQTTKPSELIADIDFGGLSLEDFAASTPSDDVTPVVEQSIDECMWPCFEASLVLVDDDESRRPRKRQIPRPA